MKTVSVEEFRDHLDQYLAETAAADVVLTQNGEPWVVLRSIGRDEDRLSETSQNLPEFWQMIQRRRQENVIRWGDAKRQLNLDAVSECR